MLCWVFFQLVVVGGGFFGGLLITVHIFRKKSILGNKKIRWILLGKIFDILDKLSYQLAKLTALTC